jgi:hypothetical protein
MPTAQGLPPAEQASLPTTEPDPSPVEPRHLSFKPIACDAMATAPSPLPLQGICNRSSKAAPTGNSCPGGHPLIRVAVSVAGLECDVCGADVPAGDASYSCEPCDYDTCRRCSEDAGAAEEESCTAAEGEGRKRQARPAAGAAAGAVDATARPVKAARLAVGQARRVAAPTGLALALCPTVARGEAEALRAAAHALGGVKVHASGDALPTGVTHVVLPADATSLPLRGWFGAARGLWLVEPAWVYSSLEAGRWLEEESYEIQLSGVREARLRAREAASGGEDGVGPLGGVTVCFWGRLHLPQRMLAALVRAAGGAVVPSHRAAGVTIVTDDLQHAARHAAPLGSGGGGGEHVAPRVVEPKWIFDQICPPARAEESAEGSAAEAPAAELQLDREGPGAAWQPEGTSGLDPGAESDCSDGFSEEY